MHWAGQPVLKMEGLYMYMYKLAWIAVSHSFVGKKWHLSRVLKHGMSISLCNYFKHNLQVL